MTQNLERIAAELIAEAESLKNELAEARPAVAELRNEVETTRQYLRTVEEDRSRRAVAIAEATGYAGQLAEDVKHIRDVVDRLDGLVNEAVAKLRTIKLPKFLTGLGAFGDQSSTER